MIVLKPFLSIVVSFLLIFASVPSVALASSANDPEEGSASETTSETKQDNDDDLAYNLAQNKEDGQKKSGFTKP